MAPETKGTVCLAATAWLTTAAAAVDVAVGNPTAINAVIGCAIPGVALTAAAIGLALQDRRRLDR